ncbi:ABC-three component system protein [Singulisphaera acidiphila]|nr:ABC-three component system protein [Singulisphaera acidiphila]
MLKCRCILANAKAFQDLFWAVMKTIHKSAFEPVQPQGSKGDGGNDGYLPKDKHYYQLYAPINPKEKAAKAAEKLGNDFAKVKAQWGGRGGRGISMFTFAYNDKYEGVPKDISMGLQGLRSLHKTITFASYGAADLETDFFELDDTDWDRILGGAVPDPDRIVGLDYSVLGEVIRHIMACDVDEEEARMDLPPGLDEKIELNRLSRVNATRILNGNLQTGHIERYFRANSAFALSELRDHVVGVYEAAKLAIAAAPPVDIAVVDAVFLVFRRNLFPRQSTAAASVAVDAIIGYFFEACDVFDPSPSSRGLPGATP